MDLYFSKFPLITYGNIQCVDITRRVTVEETAKRYPNSFYDYEVKSGYRPDMVSDVYYQDSYMDWLLFLTNDQIDPLYDWYLNDDDFNAFIVAKYGSIAISQQKILGWQSNWFDDNEQLNPSYYDTNLPEAIKKYYEPVYAGGKNIVAYKRKQEDIFCNTNKIISFSVDTLAALYTPGERVIITNLGVEVGSLEVISSNSGTLIGKHILGNTTVNNVLVGQVSGATTPILTASVISSTIADSEGVFWSPLYAYDFEQYKNEQKKFIKILDSNFASEASRSLKIKLNE